MSNNPAGMEKVRLLGCPFCGGSAEIEQRGSIRQSMIIACTHCNARTESGDVYGLTDPENYRWNKRSNNTPTPSPAADEAGFDPLNEIILTLQGWLSHQYRERRQEGLHTDDDTAIMTPPVWPSRGMIKNWIAALQVASCRPTKARIRAEVARETERCAKVAESRFSTVRGFAVQDRQLCEDIATAIRDRASLAGGDGTMTTSGSIE